MRPTKELNGETIPSGPFSAVFSVGSAASAQGELSVPITPTTSGLSTYARALDAHLASSYRPVRAMESSHD